MGQVEWSPKLAASWARIAAWNALIRVRLKLRINSRLLRRLFQRAGLPLSRSLSLQQACLALQDEWSTYKNLKKQAAHLRTSFLERLAAEQAMDQNLNPITHLQQLRDREWQRKLFRQIRSIVKPDAQRTGLLCVIHPDGSECTTKTSMETTCLEENQRRFHQADDTPLLTDPLFALVGPLGDGPARPEILKGQFQHPDVDPVVTATLNSLSQTDSTSLMGPVRITVADYQAIWRRSDERTSSGSYHALHFGHYIALSKDEELATLHTQMVDITLMSGYSPARWRIGLNVMIPKKLGDFRVEQLRTILLYDAEFNALLKWLGRLIMARAEELKVLAPEQYGSRHGLAAIYQSLNMQLTFDIIRQWRIPAAVCSNDAKACYDRIVHAFASLAIQRLGVPIGPIQVMFATIQQLQHHIRTIHGDSETSFSALSSTVPIQGVGQGNGAGPQIWAVVSSPIFDMVRAHGLGATFSSNVTKANLHLVGFGFVDDVDLVAANSSIATTPSQIVNTLQKTLDLWEKGFAH